MVRSYITLLLVTAAAGMATVHFIVRARRKSRGRMWNITIAIVAGALFVGCVLAFKHINKLGGM